MLAMSFAVESQLKKIPGQSLQMLLANSRLHTKTHLNITTHTQRSAQLPYTSKLHWNSIKVSRRSYRYCMNSKWQCWQPTVDIVQN